MKSLETLDLTDWDNSPPKNVQLKAIKSLEQGKILYFPALPFTLSSEEKIFFSPEKVDPKRKNMSYDLKKDRVGGALWADPELQKLKEMLKRYALTSRHFLEELIPHYKPHLIQGKTSFRPVEICGRDSSVRKDDTRLHVDAFPSNPTKGLRLLRIFTNINNEGKARVWRVGEPFDEVVKKFASKVARPLPGSHYFLKLLKITKSRRTLYDHYMLHMHNQMKEDSSYQRDVSQEEIQFPAGSSWIVYTDQVSHAAMSGQHVLEQTFSIPTQELKDLDVAPLTILENFLKRPLI